MNSWNEKGSFTLGGANPADSSFDNFCSMSEEDDSGHFTVSKDADLVELGNNSSHSPSRTKKEFSCNYTEIRYEFDDDGCYKMSTPGVLHGIKSAISPHNSDSDDSINKKLKRELSSYPNTHLGEVLHDFNAMFRKRLQYIDNASRNADTHTKKLMMERRNEVLEHWAKDVCSQNMLLIHTVEELEEEANREMKTLQSKINETTNLDRSHMEMIQKYEKQVEMLLNEQSTTQKQYELLTYQHTEVSKSYKAIRQKKKILEDDNDSLSSLVCRIRDMGVWDVNGLQLQPRTYDLLFGLYPNLAGSEVQTVFTREKARNIFDTEIKSKEMEKEITELRDAKKEVDVVLDEKDKTVITLEAEVKSLSTVLKHYQTQCDDLKKVLVTTQDKLIQVTNKSNMSSVETKEELTSAMSRRDQDIKDMLNELRDLKTQLNRACDERQSAIYEAKMLKRELGDRTSEMLEMRNILQIIQNETECTRSAVQNVQEKQDHLTVLKEQIHSYHEKYEQAQTLRSSKGEIIQSLQQQMSMLHEKVIHMEIKTDPPTTSFEEKECAPEDSVLTATVPRNLIPSTINSTVSATPKRFEVPAREKVANIFEEGKYKEKSARRTHLAKESVQSGVPISSLQKTIKTDLTPNVYKVTLPKESTEKSSTVGTGTTYKITKIPQMNKAVNVVGKAKTVKINEIKIDRLRQCKDSNVPREKVSPPERVHSSDKMSESKHLKRTDTYHILPTVPKMKSRIPIYISNKGADDSTEQRSTLNNLLEVTLKGSKALLKKNPKTSFSLVACHSRRTLHTKQESKSTEGKISSVKQGILKSQSDKTKGTKLRLGVRFKNVSKINNSDSSVPSEAANLKKYRAIFPSRSGVSGERILQSLPQHSTKFAVKNWIESSSSICITEGEKRNEASKWEEISPRITLSISSRQSLQKQRYTTSSYFTRDPIFTLTHDDNITLEGK